MRKKSCPLLCRSVLLAITFALSAIDSIAAEPGPRLKVLFLGDNGIHKPAERFKILQPVLAARGIDLTYTDELKDLNSAKLQAFDCLAIYANQTKISPEQETALLDFVASGKGLVPLHCASYCFLNSPKYVELIGGQFKSHGTGVFRDTIVRHEHPVMAGLKEIESWDESYVHTRPNTNRVVLAERRDDTGAEPYTWVRTHGKGRVFYTAWGHDERTWSNAGFQKLVENGIRWAAAGAEPAYEFKAKQGLKPFEYAEADVPFYDPGRDRKLGTTLIKQMQKPVAPEESAKHIVTLPGFEAKLFAAEPLIKKPICMAFDERGRLWVAETVDYPNELKSPSEGRDRIVILEDTNNDGVADKLTVFADKLSIPTSITFYNGGIIVVQAPDTLFLKSSADNDHADVRQILFSGWGTRDTHAGPSNIRWGFDNWIWGVVGYSGFNGTVRGEQNRFTMGFYRFKPDGSKLEFVRSSNNNTWGFGWSEDGIAFGSTANGNPSMYMPIPNRYYEAVNGWSAARVDSIATSSKFFPLTEKVRQVDVHGGYTAAAGHALYTARNFPKEYWNRVAFVTEPTGHLIGQFVLEPNGGDFIARNNRTFLASDDEWTSPIAAEVGPDGALWVIDWYNYIVQHNPTPTGFKTGQGGAYETPLRDKTHGRIYRIMHQDAKPSKPLNLAKASPAELVATLQNDNLLWRMHAQRLLVERKQMDTVPALLHLVRDTRLDEIGLNSGALHALWTLHGLGALDGANKDALAVAVVALKHPAAGVRRTAIQVLPRNEETAKILLTGKLFNDVDAQVRLAAFLAFAELPVSDAAGAAIYASLQVEKNSKDKWIQHATIAAAAKQDAGFLKAALASVPHTAAPQEAASVNLIQNASFENETAGKPLDWTVRHYNGQATQSLSDIAHSGARSIRIESKQGADSSWFTKVKLQPNSSYKLSAWIKTENVKGATGALLNIHEGQGIEGSKTSAVIGTKDWTRVETSFNSGAHESLTINCLFGGWGHSTGVAWFDDLQLIQTSSSGPLAGVSAEVGQVLRIVTGHYASRVPVESVVPTLLALNNASSALALPILDGLASGWPSGTAPKFSPGDEAKLVALMNSLPNDARGRLVTLADRWSRHDLFGAQIAAIAQSLQTQFTDPQAAVAARVDAAGQFVGLNDRVESVKLVLSQLSLTSSPELAKGFIGAVAESRNPQTAGALLEHWSQLTPASRRTTISALLRRTEWVDALLDAVDQGQLKRPDIAAEYWGQLKSNPNQKISARAQRLEGAKPAASSAEMDALTKKLLPIAAQKGDFKRGQEVFESVCINCHTFEGKGAKIGPELTGIGARSRADILVDIIDPNRSVEANFRQWSVTTKAGETLAGRLETETQTSIEILDLTGQKHVVQRKEITNLEASNLSIMPIGFEALPESDLASLLEYLTSSPHAAKK